MQQKKWGKNYTWLSKAGAADTSRRSDRSFRGSANEGTSSHSKTTKGRQATATTVPNTTVSAGGVGSSSNNSGGRDGNASDDSWEAQDFGTPAQSADIWVPQVRWQLAPAAPIVTDSTKDEPRPCVQADQIGPGATVVLAEQIGNVLQQAMTIADVDGDGLNEIVVGTLAGNLAIFKGVLSDGNHDRTAHEQPQATQHGSTGAKHGAKYSSSLLCHCNGLDSVTAVDVGDIRDAGSATVVCCAASGICYFFDVQHALVAEGRSPPRSARGGFSSIDAQTRLVAPSCECSIPQSPSAIHVSRIGMSETNELFVADGSVPCVCRYKFKSRKQPQSRRQPVTVSADNGSLILQVILLCI